MKHRAFFRHPNFLPVLLFSTLAWGCSGASGPAGLGGGPGGAAVGESSGAGPVAAVEGAFNPGSIQAGGEGHGQETRRFDQVVTIRTKDGRGNCGATEIQAVFEGEGAQPILMSWVSGSENGPFGAFQSRSMGSLGKAPLPECPLLVTVEGEQFRTTMTGRFLRLVATYTDSSGKFFQSEPVVMACRPACAAPPCETCLQLKEESEIAEEDRVRRQIALPSPVDFEPPSLPNLEKEEASPPRLRVIEASDLLQGIDGDLLFRR